MWFFFFFLFLIIFSLKKQCYDKGQSCIIPTVHWSIHRSYGRCKLVELCFLNILLYIQVINVINLPKKCPVKKKKYQRNEHDHPLYSKVMKCTPLSFENPTFLFQISSIFTILVANSILMKLVVSVTMFFLGHFGKLKLCRYDQLCSILFDQSLLAEVKFMYFSIIISGEKSVKQPFSTSTPSSVASISTWFWTLSAPI